MTFSPIESVRDLLENPHLPSALREALEQAESALDSGNGSPNRDLTTVSNAHSSLSEYLNETPFNALSADELTAITSLLPILSALAELYSEVSEAFHTAEAARNPWYVRW